jgi:hypothetical protein
MIYRAYLLLASSILVACTQSSPKYDKPYFDFDSLVSRQVVELSKGDRILMKRVTIDDQSDSTSLNADSLTLANELDVFRQLDVINKPLFRDAYEITDREKDTRSNLWIRTYRAKHAQPAVPYLKFYYSTSPLAPRSVEAEYRENNSLFFTRRKLMLEFDDTPGEPLMVRYQLKGTQKMILSDSVNYSVEVEIAPRKVN